LERGRRGEYEIIRPERTFPGMEKAWVLMGPVHPKLKEPQRSGRDDSDTGASQWRGGGGG